MPQLMDKNGRAEREHDGENDVNDVQNCHIK
jgi:hypothetical protein